MRRALGVAIVAIALIPNGCMNPELEARQWDEIQTLQNTVSDMQTRAGDLEVLVDSLKKVTAKQDTALRLLADFTGAIIPGYRNE